MNKCEYCGKSCRYNTCNHSCAAKAYKIRNPEIAGRVLRQALEGHKKATIKRWTRRIIEMVPNKSIFSRREVCKLLARQHRFSYNRGYSARNNF